MRSFILLSLIGYHFCCAGAQAQQTLSDQSFPLHPAGKEWQVYTKLNLLAAYDAIPVRNFDSDWSSGYAPKAGRNLFLQRNRAEFGVEKDGWQIGLEYRQQGSLDASHDMVEFYHMYQQRERPVRARDFAIDGQFQSWSAAGLRLAHSFALSADKDTAPLLMISGSVYANPRMRDMAISGTANYQSNDVYSLAVTSLESNTRYRYPFMQNVSPSGSGASISLALQWPLRENLTLHLAANDLWSRMRWSNLPTVRQQLNSEVTSYDQDGYVNYRPLLSGQNSQMRKQRSIGASAAASLEYRLAQWQLKSGVDYLEGSYVPMVSASYPTRWGSFTGSYESRFHSVGIGYDYGIFGLHLRSNRWSLSQASALGLDASLRYRF